MGGVVRARLKMIALSPLTPSPLKIVVNVLTYSKDRQLLRILLVDVGVHLIFTAMMSVVLTDQMILGD